MINSRKSVTSPGFFIGLVLFLFVLVSCTPILQKPSYIVSSSIVVVLFLVMRINMALFISNRTFFFAMLSYVALTAVYRILGVSDDAWGNSMLEYSFFITFLLFLLIDYGSIKSSHRFFFWIVLIIMMVNVVDNIALSILFPQINDYRSTIDEETLASLNAGDSTFYTMSVFCCGICYFVFLNTDNKRAKFFMLLAAIIGAIYILGYCHKGSSIVYLTLMLLALFVANKVNPKRNVVVPLALLCLFSYFIIYAFKDEIISLVISLSPSERITTRLITLIDPKNINADEVTVTGRTDLYFLSLKTWLSNPINFFFGIGDARDAIDAAATKVGNHADFLDVLPRFGIIGGMLLYSAIYKMIKYVKSLFDFRYKSQISVIIAFFIISGCSKVVIVPEVACTLFLLLPLSANYVNKLK